MLPPKSTPNIHRTGWSQPLHTRINPPALYNPERSRPKINASDKWTQTLCKDEMTDEFIWTINDQQKHRNNETEAAIHTDMNLKNVLLYIDINVHQYHTRAHTQKRMSWHTQRDAYPKHRVSSINTEHIHYVKREQKTSADETERERQLYFILEDGWEHKKRPRVQWEGELQRNVKKGFHKRWKMCLKGGPGVTTPRGKRTWLGQKRENERGYWIPRVIVSPWIP